MGSRLTNFERKAIHTHTPPRCEISGEPLPRTELEIHHIVPVAGGGSKDLDNLMLLGRKVHKKLHILAKILARRGDQSEAEWIVKISEDARELERLARILSGECPSVVYYDVDRWGKSRRNAIARWLELRIGHNTLAETES